MVIVGGGFGGIEAARALARAPVDVTLVDRHNYHCFQPLLYQVATAALSPAEIAWPIRSVVRRQPNLTVLMATATGVDADARRVFVGEHALPYDYLALATGATHSYFGHDEWAPFAPGLKQIDDATDIRRKLLLAFERAEWEDDEAERRRLLTFIIVGAGPTGVELAGAIAEVARQALPADFRRIDARMARVCLIEAGPRILPSLPENLSSYAARSLAAMGVEIMTATRVTDCDARGVETEQAGRIDAGVVVWAAGVVSSPAAQWIGVEKDRAGRALVGPDLSVPGRPEIFIIGDAAAVAGSDGRMVPGVAPAAKQMGRYVGRLVAARVSKTAAPAPFCYRHSGDLATIGRKAAVVKLGRFQLTGFVGWLFWGVAHIYFLIGIRNRFVVAFSWFWSYLTYQRAARLITGREGPPAPGRSSSA
ncbi:MAG: FAD-dependent oxidoreductase [Rhizobiales bacterium 65-9]|nr:MAG: FAD-dependent oxidoreductase [Rhizobiales bacterium 65-9]